MRRFKRFVSDVVDTVMAGVMMVLLLGGSAVAAVVMIVLGVIGAAASAAVWAAAELWRGVTGHLPGVLLALAVWALLWEVLQ